jgi:hypothetical protein
MLNQLISDVGGFGETLRRGQSKNVNDQSSKDRAIDLATQYFAAVRPTIVAFAGSSLPAHDERWQQLVRLAHGANPRRSYVRIVADIRRELIEYRITALAVAALPKDPKPGVTFTQEEALILSTLGALLPSAAASYRQALTDLHSERVSYRGTAAEFRESLRETLDHLAPDADVQAQPGFAVEEGQTKPTMKQKMRHVLKSRDRNKSRRDSAEKAMELADSLAGDVMRAVYSRASLATHVQASKAEVKKIKRYVDTLLFELLEIT